MSNDDSKIASDWLRKLYEEAWKQYSHEDNLAQSRTNFYATVHAALFALLAAVIRRLYDVGGATIFSYHVHLGLVFVGVVMIGVASLSLCLLHNWKDVMVAGRQYLDLRLATVLAIEALAQIPDEIGLASIEVKWRRHTTKDRFHPFPSSPGLNKLGLQPPEQNEGWSSILSVIHVLQKLAKVLFAVGGMWRSLLCRGDSPDLGRGNG